MIKRYYLDINNKIYKKCYINCKYCYGEGNETINNCIECNDNLMIINNSIYNTNCYEKCNYYYYFNEANNLQCTEICPNKYGKLIIEKNQCIDKCYKDDIYKYEYNDNCYINCPNGTYELENNEEKICYETNPDGYYFDNDNKLFKKCYETCNKCNIGGNIANHNCLECRYNYIFHKNNLNITNCYINCENYYYFDELNEYKCTLDKMCPEQYNKLIQNKSKCIDDCTKDDIYKYNYKNICFQECPSGTLTINETDYICYEINNDITTDINSNIITDLNIIIDFKTTYIAKDQRDEDIEKYRSEFIKDFNITEGKKDIIKKEEDVLFQMTTTENQKNNSNKNVSTIDLGDCEEKLKKAYGIDESLPLIIFKIDYFSPDSLIPIIGYEIYHPITKEKLDLSHCKDILIKLNIPVNIDESKLYKYDPNSEFYTDNCFSYTSENGTDLILNDRKQEYSNNNLALCEGNCNYTGYDKDNKQSSCNCNVKNKMDLISEIIEKPVDSNENKEETDSSSKSSSGSSNIISIKCTKALFSKEGLKNNISSYILLIFIGHTLISILLFIKCGYSLLNAQIRKILNEKDKIAKKNKVTTKRNKVKSKKKWSNNVFNFPPKKGKKRSKGTINIKVSSKIILNKNNQIINQKVNLHNNQTIMPLKSKNGLKISYNDYELNNFDYRQAISYDKRSCCDYYFSLIKRKNPLIFSFCPVDDYNSMIIKTCIFSLSFSIYYAINFVFFDDNIMHKIYELGGKYDVFFFLPKIAIAFGASYYITIIIKIIFLSERNIVNIRSQMMPSSAYAIWDKEKKNMIIKYSIFFILSIIFLAFFWMLLSSFGAVFQNTQIFIFKNTLISFSLSLFYPFFNNIFPCMFRMCALKSSQKNNGCIYSLSKLLQEM